MSLKDEALGWLVKFILNRWQLERYGKMKTFDIDSTKKELSTSLLLKGEKEPIEAKASYHVEKGDGLIIVIDKIWVSREWANEVANQISAEQRRIPVPSGWVRRVMKLLGLC
jgi:hypothetical protein